ncbi:putative reverse transcriptase domain-containing protein [Tanacetum coccineum]
MLPTRRTTRTTPATTTNPTTTVTNAQLQALIDQGVAAALAERDASRSRDGDNSHGSGTGGRRQVPTQRECTYTDFLKCQPINFKGTEGVVKFASSTLQGSALNEWNSHLRAFGQMNQGTKVERESRWFPDMIHGSVKASKPQSMQEAIEFATEMMDKKMITAAERQAENKRKYEDAPRNTQNQQQPFKRNNVARAYTAGPGDKKPYGGTKPLCAKCNYHHDGPCIQKCTNCKKLGHSARDCKVRPTANNNNNNNNNNHQRTQGTNPRVITCFECRVQGHYKSDCPKLKNGNQGNRAGNGNAVARAYVVGSAGTNPNSNVVTDSIVRVPLEIRLVIFHGTEATTVTSPLNIISVPPKHKYLLEGCPIFLAQVTMKKAEDKSKEKQLEEVPIVQDFPEIPKVQFLGRVIDSQGILVDPAKIESVKDWASPKPMTKQTQRRSILMEDKAEQLLVDKAEVVRSCVRSEDLEALSQKERVKPLRVRALVMTIGLDLPKRILEAQIEARKPENLKSEDIAVGWDLWNVAMPWVGSMVFESLVGGG